MVRIFYIDLITYINFDINVALMDRTLDIILKQVRSGFCLSMEISYRQKSGAERNKWVIALEGGGLCFDKAGCTARLTVRTVQIVDSIIIERVNNTY